jgi:hypothetical protein
MCVSVFVGSVLAIVVQWRGEFVHLEWQCRTCPPEICCPECGCSDSQDVRRSTPGLILDRPDMLLLLRISDVGAGPSLLRENVSSIPPGQRETARRCS